MLIKSLVIQDFGLFRGTHEIDLLPRVKYGKRRPVVLFGGLNGAGKTTTLTALRVALYGRQSLGRSVPLQRYHEYLRDSVHRSKEEILQPISSSIEIDFTFGRLGSVSHFKVIRSWVIKGKQLTEHLEIQQDGDVLKDLSVEQLQSFLNELIPIGVADLFFFDGEKIADLAEDDGNEALVDAINRLLGLDIIERLNSDLGIYLKDQNKSKLPAELLVQIEELEDEYEGCFQDYQQCLNSLEEFRTQSIDLGQQADQFKVRINDLGGVWAETKQSEELKVEKLIVEKDSLTAQIRELLADAVPLAIVKKQLNALLTQLQEEQNWKRGQVIRETLTKHVKLLEKELVRQLGKGQQTKIATAIKTTFPQSVLKPATGALLHDISDTEFQRVYSLVETQVPDQQKKLKKLNSRLASVEKQLSIAATNISRAPDKKRIQTHLDDLGELQKERGSLDNAMKHAQERAKKALRESMDCLRKLRDKEVEYGKNINQDRAVTLADQTRNLLNDFSSQTKTRKIAVLEQEFVKSFRKLARKEDMDIHVSVDIENFRVHMRNQQGQTIDKKKLSAGEKQIYAIAMLEALGRTSGRNLPIIIDTPLGRLDSEHREKLIKNYFPTASHQVIILSTDTEIDEEFYQELSPEISHAYSVEYDAKHGCSNFNEGYFWRATA